MAVLHKPAHDRPVRQFDAEDLGAGVGVGVEVHEAQRSVDSGAGARVCLGDRVVATEDHGERARGQDLPHGFLDGGVGAGGVGRNDRGVAEVENPELGERVDPNLEVRTGRAARRADRARREAGARPIGDELIRRRAHYHDVRAPEVGGVLRVGHAAV
jgi:hypothetical protein